jgi:O-acetyl-ADP-ribose deacetylase (regulator of RNase III)
MIHKVRELIDGRLIIAVGDITKFQGDAIVNAAKSTLYGGGGVDGAIHRAGGPAILEECRIIRQEQWRDGLPAGKAVATTGGRLPARYVIHTVGPIWEGGGNNEPETLFSCYRESLDEARKLQAAQIAFPAISTGVFGYPREKAAVVAYQAASDFLSQNKVPERVWLVFFTSEDANIFLEAITVK